MSDTVVREIALREAAAVCMQNADAIDSAIASGIVTHARVLRAKADQARANHYAILALIPTPTAQE